MPRFTVVDGGKPPPNPIDEERAYRVGIAELRRLQAELGTELDDIYSLMARRAITHLAVKRGTAVAILLLQQELAALEDMGSNNDAY